MGIAVPVTKSEAALARKIVIPAKSSGKPQRFQLVVGDDSYANRTETVPRPAMFASKASPGLTGTIGPSAPESTTSPARSGRLRLASAPASQAIALRGFPRHAAPVPVETTSCCLV